MIRFVCTCGHPFEVDDDLGGVSIQCPKCNLLVDVPTLQELDSFTDEGTYRLDGGGGLPQDNPDRLADLGIIYSKDKIDEQGNEIDLRTLPAGRSSVRGFYDDEEDDQGEIDLKPREPIEVFSRPKYDPETGELIKPIDLAPDPVRDTPPQEIPMAMAAISYASGNMTRTVSPMKIVIELLMPMNMVVMFFLLCGHVFSAVMWVSSSQVLFFLMPAFLLLQCLMLAHYGNVIDHTGRQEFDDLPRPLRDISWHDDMWSPFVAMAAGLMIAFAAPLFIFLRLNIVTKDSAWIVLLAIAQLGTVFGPALLITTNLSGSVMNLRPDRVLKVMRICGWHYVGVTALWLFTWPMYFILGWVGFDQAMRDTFSLSLTHSLPDHAFLVVVPSLVLGIYLMHWFCWYLGIMYRAHQDQFPWVLQRHERVNKGPHKTHADRLGRKRRPLAGHLPPTAFPGAPPPPPPPPASSRAARS
jgi:hypothetical protein